ncbi:MAG: hypothetical protein NTX82_03360 [Candidatus Parcubacteria bacterium]|nr:hypothetical protein [Candidatus Parcubacteria bacterium]
MKIFQIEWIDGLKELVGAKDWKSAPAAAGVRGTALSIIDCVREVPSMSMTEIAKELGLSVLETVFFFRGTFGKPKLGEGLFEAWTEHAENNLVPKTDVEIFIKRVKEHRASRATQRVSEHLAQTATT